MSKTQSSWVVKLKIVPPLSTCKNRFINLLSSLEKEPIGSKNQLHRTNQVSNFLGGCFSNRDNVRASIQFRSEGLSHYLTWRFFLNKRLTHFHINSTRSIRPVKWLFQALKSASYFFNNITPMKYGANTKLTSWGKVISSYLEDYKTMIHTFLWATFS